MGKRPDFETHHSARGPGRRKGLLFSLLALAACGELAPDEMASTSDAAIGEAGTTGSRGPSFGGAGPTADASTERDAGNAGEPLCADGTHACGVECVADDSPLTCGIRCEPCAAPSGGSVLCDTGLCVPACPEGQRACAGECIGTSMPCTTQCPSGSHDCAGVCIEDDSVNGCGQSCSPCASPQYGGATCDGVICDYVCDGSHKKCDGECIGLDACCSDTECRGGSTCVDDACQCTASELACGSGAQLECVDGNCCDASDCEPSATCSSRHVCDCAPGQVRCGSGTGLTCRPSGSCCADDDCANGFACIEGECTSWCGQQQRPAGVAVSDYQCLDFDLSNAVPWTAGTGAATVSASQAYSAPRSLRTSDSTIEWETVGAGEITGVALRFEVLLEGAGGPLPPGYEETLVCLDNPGIYQCLVYSQGATPPGMEGPYTGYYVYAELSGGAFLTTSFACAGASQLLSPNMWHTIEYNADERDSLLLDGASAGSCPSLARGTNATVILGLAGGSRAAHYDNVVVSVAR